MTIRIILSYVKQFLGVNTNNSNIDNQFEYLLEKALDKGISSDKLIEYSINLYNKLLTDYSNTKVKSR